MTNERQPEPQEEAIRDGVRADRAQPGSLYVVATPLGHLRDVTLRALDILRSVDVVLAEDTRVTATLLRRYSIDARTQSVHAYNESRRVAAVIDELASGKSVAIVTDAGTPAVSDPGARVVRAVIAAGFRVVPIPGPSAVATAISVAGLAAERFVFLGFPPAKAAARRETLDLFGELPAALVIYEAPHRVRATIAELAGALAGDRMLIVAREMTKKFETIARMRLSEAEGWLGADAERERGEFVLIVDAPVSTSVKQGTDADAERWLDALLDELPPARAARLVARMTSLERDALYARALALKSSKR